LPISAQRTVNMYPEINPTGAAPTALQNWPGLSRQVTTTGKDQGAILWKGDAYQVRDGSLYKVAADYSETLIGSLVNTGRLSLDSTTEAIVLGGKNAGGEFYFSDGSTLTQITDPDLKQYDYVTVLNNQAIFGGGQGSEFAVGEAGDIANVDALNIANAEMESDILIRPFAHNQLGYMFGGRSIEVWWNSGSGAPPVDRQDVAIEIGLHAPDSLVALKDDMFFLGHDKNLYSLTGYTPTNLFENNSAVSYEIQSYSKIDDAIGHSLSFGGQDFYIITFPTEGKCWAFSKQTGFFELAFKNTEDLYPIGSYLFYNGNHVIFGADGNTYNLDFNVFQDDGESQIRIRDMAPVTSASAGIPGYYVTARRARFIVQRGTGTISGQGSDPVLICSVSADGGRTFSPESHVKIGKMGSFEQEVTYNRRVKGRSLVYRIRVSDPAYFVLYSGMVELKVSRRNA